jgi:hypothetical protein
MDEEAGHQLGRSVASFILHSGPLASENATRAGRIPHVSHAQQR